MRNFTAGIERASSPRRKRITGLVPALSGDVHAHDQRRPSGPANSSRSTACCTRSLSMNCMEPERGNSPFTRTRTKSLSLAVVLHPGRDLRLVGHRHRARIDLLRLPAMGEAAAGEAFAEAAGGARGIAEGQPEQVGAGIGQERPRSSPDIASAIDEASSNRAKARRPLLCRPAMASVLFSDQVMASTRQVRARGRAARIEQ